MRLGLFLPAGVLVIALAACSNKELPAPSPVRVDAAAALAVDAVDTGAPTRDAGPPDAGPVKRSLAGKNVLHIGDSMVGGTFGLTKALEKKLTAAGAKLVRHTQVNETLISFDRGPTLKDLVRTHDPDIVLITLGMNDALVPHPEVFAKNIQSIVHHVGDRECWWLGPPKGQSPSGLVKVLEDNMGTCHFFDASDLDLERTSDGIHPTNEGGAKWADAFWSVFDPG